jgi:hypothetical protein
MKVKGHGRIIPPIRTAKNGDILFIAKGERATIQVRAAATKATEFAQALISNSPIELNGELTSFTGKSGVRHVLVLE